MVNQTKPTAGIPPNRIYQISISVLGILMWGWTVWHFWGTPIHNIPFLFTIIFIVFLTTFPLKLFKVKTPLNQIVFLGVGLIYGPGAAIWSALLGVTLGTFSAWKFANNKKKKSSISWRNILDPGYELGVLVIPFTIIVWVSGWPVWLEQYTLPIDQHLPELLITILAYVVGHAALTFGMIYFSNKGESLSLKERILTVLLYEALPLPFLVTALIAYPIIKTASLGIIGGIPAIISVFLFDAYKNRTDLERRIKDLSLLSQVSQFTQHSSDLDKLLETIRTQITGLLGVDSFYIALYNPADETISYPLAIKSGETQEWKPRPIANRLTDRVIKERHPLFLIKDAYKDLNKIGVPLGEEQLHSWLGVPLITPEHTLGCLAVLSLSEETIFTKDDLNLLNTLSGVVSIALESALLYEQTGKTLSRQAEQINILELIGRQLSGSLQSEDLFDFILGYALEFTKSPWGCIAVYDPVNDLLEIKVDKGYQLENNTLPMDTGITAKVVRSGKSLVVDDVSQNPDYLDVTDSQSSSQLSVPIRYEDRVLGAISLESPKTSGYTETELQFVQQLADQAALALHNASLYGQAQLRMREQATLYLVSARLVANKDLKSVLNTVAQAFSAALDSLITGVYLWDQSEKEYKCQAVMEREHSGQFELPSSITFKDWETLQKEKKTTGPLQLTAGPRKIANIMNVAKGNLVVAFPLQIADQSIGLVLNYLGNTRKYTINELQFPGAIAAQSTIAIQNALLFSDVSQGRDRLAAVLNSVGEGVMMVDAAGRVTLTNTPIEQIIQAKMEDITDTHLSQLPDQVLRALGISQEEAHQLTPYKESQDINELTPRHSYQHWQRFYERSIAPVRAANNQILGWVIVIRDRTEEQEVNMARELLTETLVHDLRSPVGAVKTTLQLIEEAIPKDQRDPVTDQSLDIAARSADRVLSLVESMLDISQLESGNVELITRPTQIDTLIRNTIKEMVPVANEDGIVLRHEDSKTLPPVMIDQELIQRVLTNLIDNALKFTPEGGVVTISTSAENHDGVTTRVSDTGPGIPEAYHDKVFTRFGQVPGLRGRRRGSGLGLTFCRLAVEAHGGRIWIEPGSDKGGATLAFTLPAAK